MNKTNISKIFREIKPPAEKKKKILVYSDVI